MRTNTASWYTVRAGPSTFAGYSIMIKPWKPTTKAATASEHAFRPGEYVSIRNEEGEMHTYQVATVEPAT